MLNLKNNKGITLTTLIITVIVLIIIAGTAVYTGTDVLEDAKKEAFIQELQIVQNAVNNAISKIEAGQKNYGDYIIGIGENIDENANITYSADEFQDRYEIQGITQDVIVNLITGEVKGVNGIKGDDGKFKYSLADLGLLNHVSKVYEDSELLERYIKDGLILHVDGINNTGTGHDSNYAGWVDLVSMQPLRFLGNTSGESIWTDNAFIGHGVEYFLPDTEQQKERISQLWQNGTGTIEGLVEENINFPNNYTSIGKYGGGAVGSTWAHGAELIFFGSANDTRITVQMGKTNDEKTSAYMPGVSVGTLNGKANSSIIVDYDGENTLIKFIVNRKKIGERKYEGERIIYRDSSSFYIGLTNAYIIHDYIHHVRAYNRALSEEEVLNNQYIDIWRFKLI